MSQQKTLIFVGAHPDDETFGLGATLAQYAVTGVKVYYVCATRGEAGSASPEYVRGYATFGDMRWAELKCAAQALGLSGVIHLGYRDSGMPGSPDNQHPDALMAASPEEVTGRVVKAIRELRPQVVVTFNPIGGYRHPDHVAIHNAAVKAFHAAGDPKQYPQAGNAFQPQKLYFHVMSRRLLRLALRLLPLFGQDPHRLGRNKDIDLTTVVSTEFPVHAAVRLSKQAREAQAKAISCHASQLGGRPRGTGLLAIIERLSGHRHDLYMRAFPPVTDRRRESDLFDGVV